MIGNVGVRLAYRFTSVSECLKVAVCVQGNVLRRMTCGLRELYESVRDKTSESSNQADALWAGRYRADAVIGRGGFSTMVR